MTANQPASSGASTARAEDSPTADAVTSGDGIPAADGGIVRERRLWMRWDSARLRHVQSRPWMYVWTDNEGYERTFATREEAEARRADYYGDAA